MFNEKDKAEDLLKKEFDKTLSLSRSIFLLAKYYKYLNFTEEEAIDNIDEWMDTQVKHIAYKKALEEKDEKIHLVYSGNYYFHDNINVKIYLEEMKVINKLKTKGERKIAFCLLYLSKVLFLYDDGAFFCNYSILEKISGMQEKQIIDIIYKLENTNILEVISRNKMRWVLHYMDKKNESKSRVYKYPNKYKIKFPKGRKLLTTIGDTKNLDEEFIKIYKKCLDEYKFKSSVYFKRYIRRHIYKEDIINGFEIE